jgi:hypothetical protein
LHAIAVVAAEPAYPRCVGQAIAGAQVMIDLANSPWCTAVTEFFQTAGPNFPVALAAVDSRHQVPPRSSGSNLPCARRPAPAARTVARGKPTFGTRRAQWVRIIPVRPLPDQAASCNYQAFTEQACLSSTASFVRSPDRPIASLKECLHAANIGDPACLTSNMRTTGMFSIQL